MDQFGFIHEKLDIKILILFILQRLPQPIDREGLSQLVFCDDGIGYFDFTDCLAELEDTGHLTLENGRYAITDKGRRNGSAIESSIPYSVRTKAERLLTPVAEKMRRDAMITADTEKTKDGAVYARLALSDGVGEIISLRMLCADERQADAAAKKFRADAEGYYHRIIELLS